MGSRILETLLVAAAVSHAAASMTVDADPPAPTTTVTNGAAATTPATMQVKDRPPLLPEGAFLTQAAGTLEPSAGDRGWQFRFRDSFEGEVDRVIQLLPSITLEDMIRNRAQLEPGASAKFALTGKVTTYQGANYVVPLFATVVTTFPARAQRPTLAPPGAWYGSVESDETAQRRAAQEELARRNAAAAAALRRSFLSLASPLSPEAQAAERSQSSKGAGGISADDIEQELVARVGDVPRSMDAPHLPPLDPQAPQSMQWLQPGRHLHDRVGTVMRDPVNGEWRFVFESARGRVGEREAVLLPCRLLEGIAKRAQAAGGLCSGVISGEITLFEGRSYLLPTAFDGLRSGKFLFR
jgi:hypothetical protein